MLYDFIAQLQQKPERTKRMILAGATVLAALALLIVWVTTVKGRLSEGRTATILPPETADSANLPGPLATLKTGLALVLSDAKDKLGELLKANETTGNQRPIYQLPHNK